MIRLDVIADDSLLKHSVNNLVKIYYSDLEQGLYDDYDELKQFIAIFKFNKIKKYVHIKPGQHVYNDC